MNEQNLVRALSLIEEYLVDQGFRISQHNDFRDFEAIGNKARGKKVSGQFQQKKFDYMPESAFWLQFKDKNDTVAVMAVRLDRIKGLSLGDFWGREGGNGQQSWVYPKPNKIGPNHAPLAYRITGNVVYGGEFTIPKKYRENGYAGIMIFYGLLLSFVRWRELDWVYGLMSEKLAMKGFDHRMGFLWSEPRGTEWVIEPEGISTRDWLCATNADGMRRWADLIVTEGLGVLLPHKIT